MVNMHNYISCGGMKNVYTIDVVESKVTGKRKSIMIITCEELSFVINFY